MKNHKPDSFARIDEITISTEKNALNIAFLTEASLMLLCVCSCALIACPLLNIVGDLSLILSILIVPIAVTFLYTVKNKIVKVISVILSLLLFAGLIWFKHDALLNGLLYIYDSFVSQMNIHFGTRYITYSTALYQSAFISITMTALIALLSALLGYIIIIAKSPLLLGLVYAPFVWMAVALTTIPSKLALIILGFTVVALLALRVSSKSAKGSSIFAGRMHHRSIYVGDICFRHKNVTPSFVIIFAAALISVGLIFAIIPESRYKPDRSANEYFNNALTQMLKQNVLGKMFSRTADAGIGSGGLGASDRVSYKNELHLLVKSSEKKPMLLKGYIGSSYDNNKWQADTASDTAKEIFDSFYFYNKRSSVHLLSSFYPQHLNEGLLQNSSSPASVYIENVKANKKYAYLPYSYYSAPFIDNRSNNELDLFVTPVGNNQDKYTAWYYNFDTANHEDYTETGIPVSDEYIEDYRKSLNEAEKNLIGAYTQYVYRTYTDMPDAETQKTGYDLALDEIEAAMQGIKPADSGSHVYSKSEIDNAVEWVREYLFSNTHYTIAPGKTPADTDFIYSFLRDGKGYCMHYAAASAIMLRSVGIPTRFVEGYTITEHDYRAAEQNGTDTLQIYDTNAHAWIEVFIADLGWIPYEVTPGFSGEQISYEGLENLPESPPAVDIISPEEVQTSSDTSDASSDDMLSSNPSSATSSSYNNTSTGDAADSDKSMSFTVILVLLMLIIMLALGIYIRRQLVWNSKIRRFKSRNLNNAVVSLFVQCERLLALLGKDADAFTSLQGFADEVESTTDFIEKNSFKAVVEISQKAQFSNHMISQSEHSTVEQFEKLLRKNTAKNISNFKRIIYKWIIIIL